VDGWSWPGYLEEIEREAERAREVFGLLVIPGVELTDNVADPDDSAHALALGLRRFVSIERGIVSAILGARVEGAAIVGESKTLLPYAKQEEAVVAYLRSTGFGYVTPFSPDLVVPDRLAA
jgi:hypothetical protein